jgi:xylulokinase
LCEGTPVVCGTSDTSIETFGAGSIEPGDGTIKLATAGTVSVVIDRPHIHETLINYPLAIPGLWYAISGTNSCASAHRWLRDKFFMTDGRTGSQAFAEMDRMAGTIKPGSEGLLFHPYLQGERAPYWDPLLKADFVGIGFRHDKAHFARALYEGIAFSLRDVLEQFRERGMDIKRARIIGGGSKSAVWRQIVANILNIEILLPETTDASFGAALIAGVGIGVFESEQRAALDCAHIIDRVLPEPDLVIFYDKLFEIYKDAQKGLEQVNHALSKLTG